jgi:hypothetical protein
LFGYTLFSDDVDYESAILNVNLTANETLQSFSVGSHFLRKPVTNWTIEEEYLSTVLQKINEKETKSAARHDVESFIITLIDRFENDNIYAKCLKENERESSLEFLKAERDLFDNSLNLNTDELVALKTKITNGLLQYLQRINEYKKRPSAISKLESILEKTLIAAKDVSSTEEARKKFDLFISQTREMILNATQADPSEDPVYTIRDFTKQSNLLIKQLRELKNPSPQNNQTDSQNPSPRTRKVRKTKQSKEL